MELLLMLVREKVDVLNAAPVVRTGGGVLGLGGAAVCDEVFTKALRKRAQ